MLPAHYILMPLSGNECLNVAGEGRGREPGWVWGVGGRTAGRVEERLTEIRKGRNVLPPFIAI